MRDLLGALLGSIAMGIGLSACALLSGVEGYAADDCAGGCTDDAARIDAAAGMDVSTTSDAAKRADAPSLDANDAIEASPAEGDGRDAGADAATEASVDVDTDANREGGGESDAAASGRDGGDAGSVDIDSGLVAFYAFDESSGTSAADSSGNGNTATLNGGATFSGGLQGDAVTLNGVNGYVSLPTGIVAGLTSFSVSAWVNLKSASPWCRIFDFGTSTTTYMFLTPLTPAADGAATRFSITTSGLTAEQQINPTAALMTASWQHVVVTMTGGTGTIYVNGVQVAQNAAMTLTPSSLGTTTQSWLGRSEFSADPYLDGQIDNFRIYDRALTLAQVQALHVGLL